MSQGTAVKAAVLDVDHGLKPAGLKVRDVDEDTESSVSSETEGSLSSETEGQ